MRRVLRALHTSDVHVADNESSVAALAATVDIALREQVDLVIIAGDLFDHARVSDRTADVVIAELARLSQPTVVIPGNHDCIDELSIYRRVDLARAGSHIHFVNDPAGSELVFEDLSLAVWARGIESHTPANRPLEGYRASDERFWRIVIVHGLFVEAGKTSHRSSQVHEEEIAALECDYVALGHVHRFWDVSSGGVCAYYSGSAHDDPDPGVNLVSFDPASGVHVGRVSLNRLATVAP